MGIVNRIVSLFQGFNWLIIPAAFLSIVFHEVSHGYVAYLMGDRTAKDSGRLSMNPASHFDVVGFICMILFGFGWAKPVPVNPYYFKKRKLGVSLVSIAGPISNIIFAFIAMTIAMLVAPVRTEVRFFAFFTELIFEFFKILASLNISLAVFNLLPIPPLDGSKILFSFLPNSAYSFVLKYEKYGILILVILLNIPLFSDFLYFLQESVFLAIFEILSMIIYR